MQRTTRLAIMGVVLAGLAATASAADTAAEAFFRPVPDLAQKYDPDKLFPQGQVFPVAFFGLNLGRDKPEGLTLIGPYGREQNVDAARKYGLKCTYTISLPMEFHSNKPLELSPVAVLDVAHGKDRFLFLANSSNEAVRVEVQGLPPTAIAAENLFDPGHRQIVRPGQWEPDLEPLEVKAFRLGPAEQGKVIER
jgi:hypothetical protein